MASRSPSQLERYAARDMHSDVGIGRRDYTHTQRSQYRDANWAFAYPEAPIAPPPPLPYALPEQAALTAGFGQLQLGRVPKTRTSPVVTRTRVARHGSQPMARPSSSGGENAMLPPLRQYAPPRRAESYSHPTPLEEFRTSRRWPPSGYRQDDALDPTEAEDLVCAGASEWKGYSDAMPDTPEGYNKFYAVMKSEHKTRTDRASVQHPAYNLSSLNMTGASDSQFPWLSLEQPCMAYAVGKSAGTTTLNYWVSKSGSAHPPTKFVDNARPRKLKFLQILDRLQHLESGLEEEVSLPCLCCSWIA
jgi:hypothetical protein